MMSDPPIIRCAILGTGMSTTVFHAPFIQSLPEHYELYSILERRATPTHSEARDRYGSKVKVVTTIEQILEDPLVDLVFVCTINETHYDFAKRALQAGKHVVVSHTIVIAIPRLSACCRNA
jgi:predicted dehydrogenase